MIDLLKILQTAKEALILSIAVAESKGESELAENAKAELAKVNEQIKHLSK